VRVRSDRPGADLSPPLIRFVALSLVLADHFPCAVRLDLCRRRSGCSASQVRVLSATRSRRISARFSLFEGGFGFCLLNWFGLVCSCVQRRGSARRPRRRTCATSTSWYLARRSHPMKVRTSNLEFGRPFYVAWRRVLLDNALRIGTILF
jgi:hypothetical protein